jgi:hypothetical protein
MNAVKLSEFTVEVYNIITHQELMRKHWLSSESLHVHNFEWNLSLCILFASSRGVYASVYARFPLEWQSKVTNIGYKMSHFMYRGHGSAVY